MQERIKGYWFTEQVSLTKANIHPSQPLHLFFTFYPFRHHWDPGQFREVNNVADNAITHATFTQVIDKHLIYFQKPTAKYVAALHS